MSQSIIMKTDAGASAKSVSPNRSCVHWKSYYPKSVSTKGTGGFRLVLSLYPFFVTGRSQTMQVMRRSLYFGIW